MDILLTLSHPRPELIDTDVLQLGINTKLRCQDTFLSIFQFLELGFFTRRHSSASSTHHTRHSFPDVSFTKWW